MRKQEYLKHLDRAFTKAPDELTASVEEAFRRGEKAVKQRQKIVTALSVAAVFAMLCAAIALAAGRMIAPKPDTVATRGSATSRPVRTLLNVTHSPIHETTPELTPEPTPTPELTPQPTPEHVIPDALTLVYTQPNSNYYHSLPDCSGMEGAVAWTLESAVSVGKQPCPICMDGEMESEETAPTEENPSLNAEIAVEWVKKLDEKAANAKSFWVYLSSELSRAWVFYSTGRDSDAALFEGGAWYLGENSQSLGYSGTVSSWTFCTPGEAKGSEYRGEGEPYEIGGEHLAYGPELFVSVIRTDSVNRVHVWKVGEDGKVIEVDAGDRLCAIGASGGGLLIGETRESPGDKCFLREHDGQLCQVCGQPEEISKVEKLPGCAALLDELRVDGYAVTGCLYRCMGADTEAEVVTVNLELNGKPWHTYLFRETATEALNCSRDWDDDIEIFEGTGSIAVDAGLPQLTSGSIEATYEGRARDARVGLISTPEPTPTPQSGEWTATTSRHTPEPEQAGYAEMAESSEALLYSEYEAVYYATPEGRYYHEDAGCSGMHGAMPWVFEALWFTDKQPCPVCIEVFNAPTLPVYATPKGKYYHIFRECSGMKNATAFYNVAAAEAVGKAPCPVCVSGGDSFCWATPKGKYYHRDRKCMGMWGALIYTEPYCSYVGKLPCPVCQKSQ